MASAVEGCVEKFFNDIDSCNAVDEAGRKHKHIGIVVAAGKLGKLHRPAQCPAYAPASSTVQHNAARMP